MSKDTELKPCDNCNSGNISEEHYWWNGWIGIVICDDCGERVEVICGSHQFAHCDKWNTRAGEQDSEQNKRS